MFPWHAYALPTTCPAHALHSFPVYDAASPRASTTPTCRFPRSSSLAVSARITCVGVIPRLSIASPRGPYEVFAYACVATAPTPALAQGTAVPTAGNFDSTATPRSPVFGSQAAMLNVIHRQKTPPAHEVSRGERGRQS